MEQVDYAEASPIIGDENYIDMLHMKKSPEVIEKLNDLCRELRITVLKTLNRAGSGHTGGCLSEVEILSLLYFWEMRHRPGEPDWPERDRFVLSKGHGAPTLYAILARLGYFPEEDLLRLRRLDCHLQGHPACHFTPGIEVCTGSLGQGLSQAKGIAMALKMDGLKSRVYVLMGDGEIQEGQIWEAAMGSAHLHLDNLTGIIDYNRIQIDGFVDKIRNIEPIVDKWRAFGWEVLEVDGHDIPQIMGALDQVRDVKGRPSLIVANTIKGKGVSFMENTNKYHGVAPSDDELSLALQELGEEVVSHGQ